MKTAIEYLEDYGIRWRRKDGTPRPTWDGEVLTLPWRPEEDGLGGRVGWAVHEISHNIFAPPRARKLPNYGLGTDPSAGAETEEDPTVFRGRDSTDDEAAVCILDLILMLELGLPSEVINEHAKDYSIAYLYEHDVVLLEEAGIARARVAKVHPFLFVYKNGHKHVPFMP